MSSIRCFFMEPTGRLRGSLRRYRSTESVGDVTCPHPGQSYHNAIVDLGPLHEGFKFDGAVNGQEIFTLYAKDCGRWPTHCACGYEFQESDEWQFNTDEYYIRRDDGSRRMVTRDEFEPGALWDLAYCHSDTWANRYKHTEDGLILACLCPHGHEWHIDGPSNNGDGWTRTGTVPDITVTPSILCGAIGKRPEYHGWLKNGYLEEC